MSIEIGEVIAIRGITISFKVYEESNKEVLFYNGKELKGLSIREYILVYRGFKKIACMVEGEYLDETKVEEEGNKIVYVRKVDARPIGYFDMQDQFIEGVKHLPMIKDPVYLASNEQIKKIFSAENDDYNFKIGKLLKEEIDISLPWHKLFNTHIGVFGNTGSGKSNTLTKLYTELFAKMLANIKKSEFLIFDFNGEYTQDQLVSLENKTVINLNTKKESGKDKFYIPENDMWETEVLSLLFQATRTTQMPFINRVVTRKKQYSQSLEEYIKHTIKKVFTSTSQKKETRELVISVLEILKCDENDINQFKSISWHGQSGKFYINNECDESQKYFNGGENCPTYNELADIVNSIKFKNNDFFAELQIRINLQLINDLLQGYVQYDHIQPLLKRVESATISLSKVIKLTDDTENNRDNKLLSIISFRHCNQEIKKVLPLIIAKHHYQKHKHDNSEFPLKKTFHLIIDEAHNILSQQSSREHETWKDYRLEVFEEIIKEGRKYGFFLTISSQRPADISPTIMSQIHNFFIHRLVNDRDLFLLDNTINTLDSFSKKMIPNLAKGSCIITGVSFDIPLLIQVDMLEHEKQPDSQDVDLQKLWKSHE